MKDNLNQQIFDMVREVSHNSKCYSFAEKFSLRFGLCFCEIKTINMMEWNA